MIMTSSSPTDMLSFEPWPRMFKRVISSSAPIEAAITLSTISETLVTSISPNLTIPAKKRLMSKSCCLLKTVISKGGLTYSYD